MAQDLNLMSFNIKLSEKESYNYIYVDHGNNIHVLVPLSRGDEIGLDNTCEITEELKSFFGKSRRRAAPSSSICIQNVIRDYIQDLEADIESLNMNKPEVSFIRKKKQHRLLQLNKYASLLTKLDTVSLTEELQAFHPNFPKAITSALSDETANCVGIKLSPQYEDSYTRIENPLFAVKQKLNAKKLPDPLYEKGFVYALEQLLIDPAITVDAQSDTLNKKEILNKLKNKYKSFNPAGEENKVTVDNQNDAERFIKVLKEVFVDYGYQPASSPDFASKRNVTTLKFKNLEVDNTQKEVIDLTYTYFETVTEDKNCGLADVFDCCLDEIVQANIFFELNSSPFKVINDKEKFSLAIQFFLGITCAYYYEKTNERLNFAEILDQYVDFPDSPKKILIENIKNVLKGIGDMEEVIIDFINKKIICSENNKLNAEDSKIINKRFKSQWLMIRESPNFDEFLILLPGKKGNFYTHQTRISLHLAAYTKYENEQYYNEYFEPEPKDFSNSKLKTDILFDALEHKVKLSHTNKDRIESGEITDETEKDAQINQLKQSNEQLKTSIEQLEKEKGEMLKNLALLKQEHTVGLDKLNQIIQEKDKENADHRQKTKEIIDTIERNLKNAENQITYTNDEFQNKIKILQQEKAALAETNRVYNQQIKAFEDNCAAKWNAAFEQFKRFMREDYTEYDFTGTKNSYILSIYKSICEIKNNSTNDSSCYLKQAYSRFALFSNYLKLSGWDKKYVKSINDFLAVIPEQDQKESLSLAIRQQLDLFIENRSKNNCAKNISERHSGLKDFCDNKHNASEKTDSEYLRKFREIIAGRLDANQHGFFNAFGRSIARNSDVSEIYRLTQKVIGSNGEIARISGASKFLEKLLKINQQFLDNPFIVNMQNTLTK